MKKQVKLAAVATILCMTIALGSTPILAQESTDNPSANMDILRQKIQADKKLVFAANMELTEAEAKVFWPLYDEYQSKLTKINQKIGNLIKEYAKNYSTMTNDVAKKLMKDSIAVEKERLALKDTMMPKFLKVLPATKVALYFQIENKIQAAVQYELAGSIPLMK